MTSETYTYEYPRPAVTVDVVLFRKINSDHHILLIQRKHSPYEGDWALPGGFVDADEDPHDAVHRELLEETSLSGQTLKPLGFWGRPDRDPRGHTISLAYWGVVEEEAQPVAGDDAREAQWFPINDLPSLAFDHRDILQKALSLL